MKNSGKKLLAGLCMMFALCCLLPQKEAQAKDVVIVIDPGHGGTEAGAYRKWSFGEFREELINLKIAQYVKEELETYNGVSVYMTRSDNKKTMDREQRLKIAKNYKADALVSIHINASSKEKDKTLTGSFACVPSKKGWSDKKTYAKESRDLATVILKELNAQVGLKNNGFWTDDELGIIVYGMKYKIPSMIIEHCFISNPDDCKKYMKTDAQLRKMGVADATGIASYYKLTKKGAAAPTAPAEPTGKTGWEKKSGKYYYYLNGEKQKGLIQVGKYFYILNNSGVRKTGFVKVNGKRYYTDSKGRLKLGWQEYKGKTYYFDRKKGAAVSGFKKIGGNKYYFSTKTFEMKTKWITIKKKRYYFSKVNGRMKKNYWLHDQSDGNWYYLGSDGAMLKNTTKVIKGVKYKFNKKGVCLNK